MSNLTDVIAKLKAAQDAVNAFKQQVDALVETFDASQATDTPVTGDTPTEKVPAVVIPPPQTFSGEHSA